MPSQEAKNKKIPRNVKILGAVSFLTDISTEMIYPLLPVFLVSVLHASPLSLGFIEGVAESSASLFKVVSGFFSDKIKKRKLFALAGYFISAISKGFLYLAGSWQFVFAARFSDRLGKGLRTAPRDALIAESVDQENKGAAYGFHRAMDNAGALIGVLAAFLFVRNMANLENIRWVFLVSLIPAILAVLVLFKVRDIRKLEESAPTEKKFTFAWKSLSPELKGFMLVSFIFTLGNSSNLFLLLKASTLGFATSSLVFLYAIYNFSAAIFTYPFSKLSDRVKRPKLIIIGYLIFSFVYICFTREMNSYVIWLVFLIYGLYEALTSGIERAYITDLADPSLKATALGMQATITGITLLPASLISGFLWTYAGPSATFYFSAFTGFLACLVFFFKVNSKNKYENTAS